MKSISIDDYQGTNIANAFANAPHRPTMTPVFIKKALDFKLEKGMIDKPLYDSAIDQLNGLIEKASKGEGSKGGHVIGHTKSGKPVYVGKKASENKDFSKQDHMDAAELHNHKAMSHKNKLGSQNYSHEDGLLGTHHEGIRNGHMYEAAKIDRKEKDSNLSADEKKILADQNKKKLDHHNRMADFHKTMLDHIKKYKEDKSTAHGSQATQDGIQEIEHHHQKQFEHHDEQASGIALDATIALSKEKGTLGQYRGRK